MLVVLLHTGFVVQSDALRGEVSFAYSFIQLLFKLGCIELGGIHVFGVLETHVRDSFVITVVLQAFGEVHASKCPDDVEFLPLLQAAHKYRLQESIDRDIICLGE